MGIWRNYTNFIGHYVVYGSPEWPSHSFTLMPGYWEYPYPYSR